MNADGMKVGDAIEFLSDRQTEKGPSAGRVISRAGDVVCIRHSDDPGEMFDASTLIVERLSTHRHGGQLWMLK